MPRRLRVLHFSTWADHLEDAQEFLARLPDLDLAPRVSNKDDPELMRMARLDCDWHGENTRALAAMQHAQLEFLPARVLGIRGVIDLVKSVRPTDEEWWLIFEGQSPQKLNGAIEKIVPLLGRIGVKIGWYAFDEASRTTTAFRQLAPHLNLLIHDELPLDPVGKARLNSRCHTVHHSWVANLVPNAVPFNEQAEDRIVFVGSKLGMTEHRRQQIDFLQKTFGEKFFAINDHSLSVADRGTLNRFKASLCPEGRKFTTPAMGMSHTDRPFWSGCMGLVPISEDSTNGGRLEALAENRLIERYSHGDLEELKACCERALRATPQERKKIYDHFNRNETIGTVLASALHVAG